MPIECRENSLLRPMVALHTWLGSARTPQARKARPQLLYQLGQCGLKASLSFSHARILRVEETS